MFSFVLYGVRESYQSLIVDFPVATKFAFTVQTLAYPVLYIVHNNKIQGALLNIVRKTVSGYRHHCIILI